MRRGRRCATEVDFSNATKRRSWELAEPDGRLLGPEAAGAKPTKTRVAISLLAPARAAGYY
jgi:hypothetical protein